MWESRSARRSLRLAYAATGSGRGNRRGSFPIPQSFHLIGEFCLCDGQAVLAEFLFHSERAHQVGRARFAGAGFVASTVQALAVAGEINLSGPGVVRRARS